MTLDFNWIDYIFISIFALLFIYGLSRGLVREIVSLLALIAAVVLAVMFSEQLATHFVSHSNANGTPVETKTISYLALVTSFLLIFVGTIIVGALVGLVLNLAVNFGGLGVINRFLGGIFGLIKAAIITTVIIFLVQMTPNGDDPEWKASKFVMYFQPAVDWLKEVASPTMEVVKDKLNSSVETVKSLVPASAPAAPDQSTAAPVAPAPDQSTTAPAAGQTSGAPVQDLSTPANQ